MKFESALWPISAKLACDILDDSQCFMQKSGSDIPYSEAMVKIRNPLRLKCKGNLMLPPQS